MALSLASNPLWTTTTRTNLIAFRSHPLQVAAVVVVILPTLISSLSKTSTNPYKHFHNHQHRNLFSSPSSFSLTSRPFSVTGSGRSTTSSATMASTDTNENENENENPMDINEEDPKKGKEWWSNLKGVFVGSGSDGMSDPRIATIILNLAKKSKREQKQQRRRQEQEQEQEQEQQQQVVGDKEEEENVHDDETIHVVYLGTATYDIEQFAKRQTQCFRNVGGCSTNITYMNVVHRVPSHEEMLQVIGIGADIIIVGGGNTLFAVDRWKTIGLIPYLKQARDRGAVLTGGSAGAICWFNGGHSDSMDPNTYKIPMIQKFTSSTGNTSSASTVIDESDIGSTTTTENENDTTNKKNWKYIRVPGLQFLPGIICPHHDKVQSNGILRATDFDQMLVSLAKEVEVTTNDDDDNDDDDNNNNDDNFIGEVGIGIDHWAALIVDNDSYTVYSLSDKPGSVLQIQNTSTSTRGNEESGTSTSTSTTTTSSFCPNATGIPGIWIKKVICINDDDDDDGDGNIKKEETKVKKNHKKMIVQSILCPSSGKLSDLLLARRTSATTTTMSTTTTTDNNHTKVKELLQRCRMENPDDGPKPMK